MEDTKEKVTRMEDILAQNNPLEVKRAEKEVQKKKKKAAAKAIVPKGKPKSGRIWKEQKTRFSSIVKTRGIRLSFEKKKKLREDLKRVKEMSRAVVEKRKAARELKKQRRIENLKRAEENRKRSEVVQVIKNTAKIKRMKKKHLRTLEKRDTNDM